MADDLNSAVLRVLAGVTSMNPLRVWQIAGRLPMPIPTEARIRAALDDLVARRAVNTARLIRPGADPDDIYWPTGALPAAVPWREFSVNGHTAADARAAREAHEMAVARAAQAQPQPEQPQPEQPQPKEPTMTKQAPERYVFGDIMRQVLDTLDPLPESEALHAEQVLARCPVTSLGSLRKTLQRLAMQGRIGSRVEGKGIKRRAYYWGLQGGRIHLQPVHQDTLDIPVKRRELAAKPSKEPEIEAAAVPMQANGWADDTPDEPLRYGAFSDGSIEIWRGVDLLLRLDLDAADKMRHLLEQTRNF